MGKVIATIVFALWAGITAAQDVVVAALGDSLTQGYGLPAEQGFVPQLEGWLQAQGEAVRVVNAGVSGDTTAGGLARVDWTLTPDVDALIVTL
ncbi:MAG: GDSL-type esterase/lipase family protein, partial [Pseudomonadota bacterium]